MITLFPSQGDFCATAHILFQEEDSVSYVRAMLDKTVGS